MFTCDQVMSVLGPEARRHGTLYSPGAVVRRALLCRCLWARAESGTEALRMRRIEGVSLLFPVRPPHGALSLSLGTVFKLTAIATDTS